MPTPKIKPGAIEQAIYTWSTSDVNGNKGQGFGALSPGLQNSAAWLGSLDLSCFQPLDTGLQGNEAHAYEGWKKQVTTGCFQEGDLSFVYRKTASAGFDGRQRNRFVVHLLVGRRNEFSLAAVADQGPHWLSAEECPLDNLPELSQLQIADLLPDRKAHDCEQVDGMARGLLERWSKTPARLIERWPADLAPAELTAVLLALVPTPLWSSIELDWRVGTDGPIANLAIAPPPPGSPSSPSPRPASVDDCPLHRAADQAWSTLPARHRDWAGFVKGFSVPAPASPAAAKPGPVAPPATTPTGPSRGPRAQLFAIVAEVTGVPDWYRSPALSDALAERVLREIEKLPPPAGGWPAVLGPDDLRAIFSRVEEKATFARVKRFFDAAAPSAAWLMQTWHTTGLAVVGAALLEHKGLDAEDGEDWAVPRNLDRRQLEKLLRHQLRNDAGVESIGLLLRGGFSSNQKNREAIVQALTAAEVSRRRLFEEVLPRADLPPDDLLGFMRENLDEFSLWLRLPKPYEKALRLGLRPRGWQQHIKSVLSPLLKGGPETDSPPVQAGEEK